jgi:transcriptional regulator with XRE-family HTH domain
VTHPPSELPARVARLLQRAAKECGKSNSEIARIAGIKRDSLRRSLSGDRPVTLNEVMDILEATENAGEETLLMLLVVGEDFALEQGGTAPARFLGELLRRAPTEIIEQLGDSIDELRPRWAVGTAKLLARTLQQHVSELNRRGDSIAERFSI